MPSATLLVKERLLALPGIKTLRHRRYDSFFRRAPGAFRGVFATFAEARRSAPEGAPLGFDSQAFALAYEERTQRVFSYDYPVLFWLDRILKPGIRVFDLGGHVGVQYYAYGRYLQFPEGFRWRVCEVPSVAEQGRRRALEQNASGLEFTTQAQDAEGFDVLISAGALQYIENFSLGRFLSGLSGKPKHLLLTKLPLWEGRDFVTLQNTGTSFAPQYAFNDGDFIEQVTTQGYELVDRWEDYRHSCRIPFHQGHRIDAYSGLYFRRA
ncbi:MAG: methyltransferase, TIGR04325 family [Myxococcaceae bacterium]